MPSHVLKLAQQALPPTWHNLHGRRRLLETLVDSAHGGSCNGAPGWQSVSHTRGRPSGGAVAVGPRAGAQRAGGSDALEWLLLSSVGQPPTADSLRTVQRYESHRDIEEWFRVL